jgi:hypothetical protein
MLATDLKTGDRFFAHFNTYIVEVLDTPKKKLDRFGTKCVVANCKIVYGPDRLGEIGTLTIGETAELRIAP